MKSMCFDFLIVGVIIGMFIGAAIMQRKIDKDTIIPEADLDTNYCDNLHIFDNRFVDLHPDTLHFGEGFPNTYYDTKGDEVIVLH
jgi:hypothetical protein